MLVSPPQSSNQTAAQRTVTTSTIPPKGHNDHSQPLVDVVICCTSIPDEKRTSLAAQAEQMGAIHRYDLTLDVTHLIVGKHDTEKYQYVARERPDVRPMTVAWVEAIRDLWVNDKEIDMAGLEREHILPTLHSLKISMTGCDDPTERANIAAQVQSNGAAYEGDLTRQITHLIAFRTEGAKYKAAKSWGIKCVSIEWLVDSLERGMILNEKLYDPKLSVEERGRGAWDKTKPRTISPGKRRREESTTGVEGAKKKLRRTASMKLNSQSDLLWGDIVGGEANEAQVNRSGQWDASEEMALAEESKPAPRYEVNNEPRQQPTEVPPLGGMFSGHSFHFYGFSAPQAEIVRNHLSVQGAQISESMEDLVSSSHDLSRRLFIMIPHNLHTSDLHDLPPTRRKVETVTVWWLERCLHHKTFLEPAEHVIGRPFPRFPIEKFADLTISTSAFTRIDLLLVTKSIQLLGAKYSEDVTPQTSVIVVKELNQIRPDKLAFAQQHRIPIVSAEWLWGSIDAGTKLSFQKFRAPERKSRRPLEVIGAEQAGELPTTNTKEIKPRMSSKSNTKPASITAGTTLEEADEMPLKLSANVSENEEKMKQEPKSHGYEPIAKSMVDDRFIKTSPITEIDVDSSSKTVLTAPAPSDHPRTRENYSSDAISDLLARTKTAIPQKETPRGRSGPKRILGRVASNMSTGSAGHSRAASMESSAHGVITEQVNEDNEDAASRTANERIEQMMKRVADEVESQPPPATQLGYHDPESERAEKEAKAKMMGEHVPKRSGLKEKTFTINDTDNLAPRARRTRNGGR